jgi:hypothetical protein
LESGIAKREGELTLSGGGANDAPDLKGSSMQETNERRLHDSVEFVGLRAQATAVGLLQLCAQLVRVGVLDEHAVTVIKDAIAKDIVLTRPRSASRDDYERSIRERLDSLFSGQEAVGTGQSD